MTIQRTYSRYHYTNSDLAAAIPRDEEERLIYLNQDYAFPVGFYHVKGHTRSKDSTYPIEDLFPRLKP